MDKESLKLFFVKLLLSIPAIIFGITRLVIFTLDPLIKLWKPVPEAPPIAIIPEDKHEFH